MMAVLGETTNVGRIQSWRPTGAVPADRNLIVWEQGQLGRGAAWRRHGRGPKKHTPARNQRIVLKPVEIPRRYSSTCGSAPVEARTGETAPRAEASGGAVIAKDRVRQLDLRKIRDHRNSPQNRLAHFASPTSFGC